MAVQITIRDVPENVRNELVRRAASQRKSMQEFLRAELERLAARPSIDRWLEQTRSKKKQPGQELDAFYEGMTHRPDSTFGTVNEDVLALEDPHFQRIDFCE